MDIHLQVGVKAFLKNADGTFLLLHRSAQKYPEVVDLWDIVGGRIEAGTGLIANLHREIFEETHLQMISTPRLLGAQDILRVPGRHVVRLTYIAQGSGEPVIDTSEHDEYRWFSIAEIISTQGVDSYVKELLDTIELSDL
jgi:ADP-ribose pyrophosphatase YjhB (NUDIX family)